MFWTGEKERQRMNCCWTVLCVIPARSVETSPLPGSAGEKHTSTVCDYTVFSTFNLECADFIFVGCETLLSGVPRNAGRKDGYYAWGKQYLVSRSCPPGPFSLGCQSKGTPCLAWKAKRCEKIGVRTSREGSGVCREAEFLRRKRYFDDAWGTTVYLHRQSWDTHFWISEGLRCQHASKGSLEEEILYLNPLRYPPGGEIKDTLKKAKCSLARIYKFTESGATCTCLVTMWRHFLHLQKYLKKYFCLLDMSRRRIIQRHFFDVYWAL